jgi:hypothetical protein
MSTRDGSGPDAPSAEATATTKTSTRQDASSAAERTAGPSTVDLHSVTSRLACARHYLEPLIAQAREVRALPVLGSPEWVVADAMTKYAATFVWALSTLDATAMSSLSSARDRRVAREDRREFLVAQREASHAVSAAVDWRAASQRPSHAELVARRAVVAVPK